MFAKTALIVTALALAAPAAAKTPESSPRIEVSYADLDLTTAKGEQALDRRVLSAAEALCPRDPGLSELARHVIARHCISDTRLRVTQRIAAAVSDSRSTRNAGREVAAR